MYILGLNMGHNATAALLKDGKIMGCVSEERFSRIKNHSGIPFKSISFLLEDHKISMKDINLIILDNSYNVKEDPYFEKRFSDAYTQKPWKNKILSKLGYNFPKFFERYYNLKKKFKNIEEGEKELIERLSDILKFPRNKIEVINHHLAHAFSPCFNLKKKTLILTLDGEGSGLCASVNIFDGKSLKIISRSKKNSSLGYLYSITTLFLGMKPLRHEFKVMGLAPYAKKHDVDKIYNKFKELVWINDSLEFESKFSMPFVDHFFSKEMKFVRFDHIAGAAQRLIEELTCEWVKKAIKKTGVKNIALSGGVFMNVKAAMEISKLDSVENLFVMPSAGDESNPIGCCYYGYKLYCQKNNKKFEPKPIEDLFLGPSYDDEYIRKMIKEKNLEENYKIRRIKNINSEVAKLLARGKIIARCSGKSEFGARALGNRSILANPSDKEVVIILNEAIKDRDFWMPFTPSILDKDEKKYIINPKNIFAPYMVIAFPSTKLAKKDLPAVMHPYDFTIRPQIITKKHNKDYYALIEIFKKLTGIGAVLNTSFNLHGEPNVLTPEDALRTVENSGLNYLVIENYLFEKKLSSSPK